MLKTAREIDGSSRSKIARCAGNSASTHLYGRVDILEKAGLIEEIYPKRWKGVNKATRVMKTTYKGQRYVYHFEGLKKLLED